MFDLLDPKLQTKIFRYVLMDYSFPSGSWMWESFGCEECFMQHVTKKCICSRSRIKQELHILHPTRPPCVLIDLSRYRCTSWFFKTEVDVFVSELLSNTLNLEFLEVNNTVTTILNQSRSRLESVSYMCGSGSNKSKFISFMMTY